MKALFLCFLAALLCSACQKTCEPFDPQICYYPPDCLLKNRPSAFEPLTAEERVTDWGKQMRLAYAFGREQDYYRVITAFKSALVFMPKSQQTRRWQCEYGIVQGYYLGCKYQDCYEFFEQSTLIGIPNDFPAFQDLAVMLYDAYSKCEQDEKAQNMLQLIGCVNDQLPAALELSTAFLDADLPNISTLASNRCDQEDFDSFVSDYLLLSKSEQKAQFYQALLPGAGYFYVGQKDAARTSFLINALFTWAAYSFFERGYYAAGIITASLEAGWYLGGINGARLAAKEYNERLFGVNGCEFMRTHDLFPILMLQTTF